eukprot:COSAG06_NODE_31442_length_521_cov_1.426540_1_plen_69_part_10
MVDLLVGARAVREVACHDPALVCSTKQHQQERFACAQPSTLSSTQEEKPSGRAGAGACKGGGVRGGGRA